MLVCLDRFSLQLLCTDWRLPKSGNKPAMASRIAAKMLEFRAAGRYREHNSMVEYANDRYRQHIGHSIGRSHLDRVRWMFEKCS